MTEPESLFRLSLQHSVSDSAQTSPSPVVYSKPRLSRSNTKSSNRRSDSLRSRSTAPNPHFKRERERQLANVPRDTLLQHTISKEHELREAKQLLTSALIQLDAIREKCIHERDIRLALEDEKKDQAVKTTKALIDTQQYAMDAKEEVRRFQLHLENSQSELHKVRDVVLHLESDKTDLERQLVRARDSARTFQEKNALLYAREEGRREGFDEGLRQGRVMHGIIDLTQAPQLPPANTKQSSNDPSSSRRNDRHADSIDTEIELRKIAEKDNYRLNLQVTQLSRELDQQRQKTKEVEADRKRLADDNARLKRSLRTKDEEIAKLTERTTTLSKDSQISDRKAKELVARRDAQVDELKARVEKLLSDNEKLRREKEETEHKLKETEKEKEKERREKESIAASLKASTDKRVAYIPMPPPPLPPNIPTSGPLPRPPSSGSGRRRFSVGSQSSTGSAPFEIVQTPRNRLSIIPEDDAHNNPSPVPWNPTFPQPMIPQIISPPESHSPRGMMSQPVPNSQFLQPSNGMYGRLDNGSQSTINISIEPPSRPPSSIDQQEVDPSGVFLSPNHRPAPLPPAQDTPLPVLPRTGRNAAPSPYEYDTSGLPTQSGPSNNNRPIPLPQHTPLSVLQRSGRNSMLSSSSSPYEYDTSGMPNPSPSPVIPGVTVPMPQMPSSSRNPPSTPVTGGQHLPPGFVPQTITDSKGATRIYQNGGSDSAPGGGGGPVYGNPLNKDREEDEEEEEGHYDVPFPSPYGPAGPSRLNGNSMTMTPATSPLHLPGVTIGPRSGVSIYAPAAPPPLGPPGPMPMPMPMGNNNNNNWGYPPGGPGPLPASAPMPEDDENDDIDSETALNTRINAGIGRPGVVPPPPAEFGNAGGASLGYNRWVRP